MCPKRAGSIVLVMMACLLALPVQSASAQAPTEDQSAIDATAQAPSDEQILERILEIYAQLDALANVDVSVKGGVVVLDGEVSNEAQAQRAIGIASRVNGVVTVEDRIERVLDVQGNLLPILDQFKQDLGRWTRALPLLFLAVLVFVVIASAGHALAKWSSLWRRIAPNAFLAELITQAVRVAALILALVVALSLVGATALMGAILGGAGLLGLAVGFAVRDTMENYISSIMLSVRQPFRANDHVVIDDQEGKVIRLTSRATVLMTLDGNHLRIPNAKVYKAVILNYTRNPERRFGFELGVDADDDPLAAMQTGLDAIASLDFVLKSPRPDALIKAVGDSNILITFTAWVSQDHSEFLKARSLAIRAAKLALEAHGFTLPEPIYRLRFDGRAERILAGVASSAGEPAAAAPAPEDVQEIRRTDTADQVLDVTPDKFLEEKVNDDRRSAQEADLLDSNKPIE